MKAILAAVLLAFASIALGQSAEVSKPDPAIEARLKGLAEELRCLVCQNQTIADSNAPLALDLRNQIRQQVAQGRTDDQIRAYMVERYGDFVLYRPPLKATTVVLWVGPALLIVGGLVAFFLVVRRRQRQAVVAAPAARNRREIEALLDDDSPPTVINTAPRPPRRKKPESP
jgi:cytochrome c-type biogenesis protein CcmH